MIAELRSLARRVAGLERSLQRPSQEIRSDGDLRLRWGRQPDGSWTFALVDAAGNPAGDLAEADIVGRIAWRAIAGAPNGWLVANGQQVTTAHPVLRGVLLAAGSPHGSGGGNPLLPNLVGKFARGTTTPGATGGADSVVLSVAQMPAHSHPISSPSRPVVQDFGTSGTQPWRWTSTGSGYEQGTGPSSVQSVGSGQAHENRPPYVDLTPLVRAY